MDCNPSTPVRLLRGEPAPTASDPSTCIRRGQEWELPSASSILIRESHRRCDMDGVTAGKDKKFSNPILILRWSRADYQSRADEAYAGNSLNESEYVGRTRHTATRPALAVRASGER